MSCWRQAWISVEGFRMETSRKRRWCVGGLRRRNIHITTAVWLVSQDGAGGGQWLGRGPELGETV